jgi:hypothetical protein
MDIISINKFVRFNEREDLYNLFEPTFVYIIPSDVVYKNFTVEEYHEMRIDLIFRDMYDLEPNSVDAYIGNIDIICFVNDIDNPLNIKKGMVLRYPILEDLDKFRFEQDSDLLNKKNDVRSKLVFPNKSTRKDDNRQKFKDSGFLLPPTILAKPKPPVRIEGGVFSVGGL